MKKYFSILSLSTLLCGCSTWEKPAATHEQRLQAQYSCKKDVHQTWYWGDRIWGFLPFGLIETGVESGGFYNQCMKSKGWSRKSKTEAMLESQQNDALLSTAEQIHAQCVSELRSNLHYRTILSHIPSAIDNKFTFYQTSDAAIPSVADSHVLAEYFGGTGACHDKYVQRITPLLTPHQKQVYAQRDIEHNAASAELARRKISYGEWAQRENQSIDEAKLKIEQ